MPRYEAVLFDLLSALIDSWSLFNAIAGGEKQGGIWRKAFLRRAYATGAYVGYESLLRDSARDVGMTESAGAEVVRRWSELQPWPEAAAVLGELSKTVRIGTVTNCSEVLGAAAAARVGVPFSVLVTAERAGFYKPDPRTYRLAIAEIGAPPQRTLFVAGSPGDVGGASGAGMDVYWHNRKRLPKPEGPVPLLERRSLRPLLSFVRERER
jgi:2-haloalkanoic acid dehalogenase type II